MKIRKALAEDAEAIFGLANQLHESMIVGRADFQQTFTDLLKRQDSVCMVGTDNSTVVAYISGFVRPVLALGGNAAYVDEIVVLPEVRGKGVGTALMLHMENWARGENCQLVGLATGGASQFYEQQGYQSRASYYKKTF